MGQPRTTTGDAGIVGRDTELHMVHQLMENVADQGGCLVVNGEPGIGKTALLQRAADAARQRGMTTLAARGTQSESHLPYGALHQLLRPLLPGLDALSPGHRRAVSHAFGMSVDGDPPERFFVALAVLELIAEAAARTPMLLVVDDLQWADAASVEAIEFVGRRLVSEPAVMLIGTRAVLIGDDPAMPRLTLAALDAAASRAILLRSAPELATALTERVLREAGGNPLALRELPIALAGVGDDFATTEHLPLTARLENTFAARLADLDERTRTLLLCAALQDGDDLPEIMRAAALLAGDEPSAATLQPAIDADLVTSDGETVRFRHPLVRSAIRQAAPDRLCREVHDAFARILGDDLDRVAWHRAGAAPGPDEAVAVILDEAAERARHRGATTSAEAWLERAADISGDERGRTARLLSAGELAYELGRYEDVQRLITTVRSRPLQAAERSRLAWLEGAFDDGDPGDADGIRRLVEGAARACDDGDVDLAALLLMNAGRRCWWGALSPDLCADVLAVTERLELDDGDPRLLNLHALVSPFTHGAAVLKGVAWWATRDVPDPMDSALLAIAAFVLGDFDRALAFCAQAATGLRQQGRFAVLAQVLDLQSWAALYLGRWDVTHTAGDEAYRLAIETRQPGWVAITRVGLAVLSALRGAAEAARELVLDAEEAALLTGSSTLLNGVEMVRGLAELGQGRAEASFSHFTWMTDPAHPAHHPLERLFQLDYYADAAAGSGHAAEARTVLAELQPIAASLPSPSMGRMVAYARAVLAEDDAMEALVAEALGLAGPPWYRARLDLLRGTWLRRQRRIEESRVALHAARTVFATLGADAWAARASKELAAAGARGDTAPTSGWAMLSAQELQIAQLAAQGLSNQEIAHRLYLSHRTVASHLYRIFPKLGIKSRAQLHLKLPGSAG